MGQASVRGGYVTAGEESGRGKCEGGLDNPPHHHWTAFTAVTAVGLRPHFAALVCCRRCLRVGVAIAWLASAAGLAASIG